MKKLFAVLTVITIINNYKMTLERGYWTVGGEIFLIVLPAIIWLIIDSIQEKLEGNTK